MNRTVSGRSLPLAIALVALAQPVLAQATTLALIHSRALDEQDNGSVRRAAEQYRAVRRRVPDFGPARANLVRVQKAGH
jgi:hypothetical protein